MFGDLLIGDTFRLNGEGLIGVPPAVEDIQDGRATGEPCQYDALDAGQVGNGPLLARGRFQARSDAGG